MVNLFEKDKSYKISTTDTSRSVILYFNEEKLKKLSASNYKIARERHNDEQIYASLISAYKQILNDR